MSKKNRKCCLCGEKLPTGDYGNNPEPLKSLASGVCCNKCNREKVIPERLKSTGINYAVQARGDANE